MGSAPVCPTCFERQARLADDWLRVGRRRHRAGCFGAVAFTAPDRSRLRHAAVSTCSGRHLTQNLLLVLRSHPPATLPAALPPPPFTSLGFFVKLRRIDGWWKIAAVLSQHTAVAA
jgi:hypothetical protein